MALTLFWRCEGTTLDGTHDYSAGDTTATASGGTPASISATAVKIGTNGILCSGTNSNMALDSASIAATAEGAFAAWVWVTTWVAGSSVINVNGSNGNNRIRVVTIGTSGSGNFELRCKQAGQTERQIATTAGNLATGNWYFIVATWKSATTSATLDVYDSSGTIISGCAVSGTYASTNVPAELTTCKWGDEGAANASSYIDNIFWGSVIADAATFLTKRDITSYTEYAGGSILPHAMAHYRRMAA